MKPLRIDGADYDLATLPQAARDQIAMIRFVDARVAELKNMQALLTRARRSYLDGLEREIVKARSGVDFSTLFSD